MLKKAGVDREQGRYNALWKLRSKQLDAGVVRKKKKQNRYAKPYQYGIK